ncbi:D-Ala-D-Ala dipeptidase [Verminephrobacter aporrectodeae subsp. tuberculatae]|uniref:M15 family metallopeptidase n=1 Tax=Verminephrobacter aporrectodeae TaxID=1110389 RepID=UPI002239070C|nr:M15 family metallopeptidase [Verminephrobacter aporrectodeae]MCW5256119.1 D-Ala-D-Ala dipeptidase [Verminephrobacter aporrectodeae subsp. tuberculatae]
MNRQGLFSVVARATPPALALLLAACAQGPWTADPPAAAPAPASAPAVQPGPPGCSPAARATLQGIADELQTQGMALHATCTAAGDGWVVQLCVLDGTQAGRVVRGPLADGYALDMGTPAGAPAAGAPTGASGFSPDVQHNRQWLRALMARHQFCNLPDAWWHFAPQDGAASAGGAGCSER